MKVERLISWFSIEDESLEGEFNVDSIDLDVLKRIFNPSSKDTLMYYPYDIDENIAKELNQYINLDFDFKKYIYQLDCFQSDSGIHPPISGSAQ